MPEVAESIRLLSTASFVAEGAGVPVIGLLFGQRGGEENLVTAWVPAGELRNYNDAEFALKLHTRMAATRPETQGLECLGWVRTRNHGEPRLVEEDRTLFDRCFPAAWQAAMVVRPSYQKPAKAAIYLRRSGSALRLDRPAQEFFLTPGDSTPAEAPAAPVRAAAPARVIELPVERPPADELEALPRGTVRAFSPWIAAMLILVGLLAGAGMAALRPARPEVVLASQPLRVIPADRAWAVEWDKSVAELAGVSAGHLTVFHDGQTKAMPLTLEQLRHGSARLEGVTGEMEVALRLDRPGYPELEQRVRVVGLARPQEASGAPVR